MLSKLIVGEKDQEANLFSDTNMWAKEEINILTNLNIINGYTDGIFKPNNEMRRADNG